MTLRLHLSGCIHVQDWEIYLLLILVNKSHRCKLLSQHDLSEFYSVLCSRIYTAAQLLLVMFVLKEDLESTYSDLLSLTLC